MVYRAILAKKTSFWF